MIELRGITWDHPRGYAPLRACADFEDIHVHWEVRSLKDFGDASLNDLAARFDLLILDHPHSGQAAQGALLPFDLAQVTPTDSLSFRSYQLQGTQWALPIDAACQVASFRPDLLGTHSLPSTWDDVFQLAENLKSDQLHIGMALCPTDSLCSFLTLAAQLGDAPIEDHWMRPESVTRVIEALCRLRDICHPESLTWNPIHLYEHMSGAASRIAYCPLAFGYTDYARPTSARPHRLYFTNIPETRGALLGGAGIGISASCKHPQAATRYAKWICGADSQSTRYTEHGGQPAHPEAWQNSTCDALTGGFLSGTRATLEQAYTRPRLPAWPDFQEALGDLVHACLLEEHSIDDTVTKLATLHQQHFHPDAL